VDGGKNFLCGSGMGTEASQTSSTVAVKSLALASFQAQSGITGPGHHFGLERHLSCWEGHDPAHGQHPQGSNGEDPTILGM